MPSAFGRLRLPVLLLALAGALSACVIADPYGGPYAAVPPPPPRIEVYGAPPAPGWLWIGGYWGWAGGRHEWVPGHWEAPRPGYRWVPHAWVHERNGWHMHEGHWQRR